MLNIFLYYFENILVVWAFYPANKVSLEIIGLFLCPHLSLSERTLLCPVALKAEPECPLLLQDFPQQSRLFVCLLGPSSFFFFCQWGLAPSRGWHSHWRTAPSLLAARLRSSPGSIENDENGNSFIKHSPWQMVFKCECFYVHARYVFC